MHLFFLKQDHSLPPLLLHPLPELEQRQIVAALLRTPMRGDTEVWFSENPPAAETGLVELTRLCTKAEIDALQVWHWVGERKERLWANDTYLRVACAGNVFDVGLTWTGEKTADMVAERHTTLEYAPYPLVPLRRKFWVTALLEATISVRPASAYMANRLHAFALYFQAFSCK